tara:strand:- start:2191 stop:3768 length:1578 start_codon:yes stop_codon:yes gene_type:complete
MESIHWYDKTLTLLDGVNLVSRIWVPKEGDGPWPALLMRQPYGREIASTVTFNHPAWWAEQGYLVIIQDVRGQGGSDGTFIGFKQEASDTTQTHKWVRSLAECNGLLGTYGFSYQGLTQLLGEPNSQPPDCLAPAMTGLDECAHWSCDGGAFWWHLGLAWGLQLAALQARRKGNIKGWDKIRSCLEDGSYLQEGPSILKEYDPKGMALDWLNRSNKQKQEWAVHEPLASWLRQPMLLIGGWWDPHLRGVLEIYKKSIQAGGFPELHVGPATHLQWWDESQQLLLSFFNKHLRSPRSSTSPKAIQKLWNITSKSWQSLTTSTTPSTIWGLSSQGEACLNSNDGSLNPNSNGKGIVNLVHDPWRPVPAIGGHLSPKPGPVDRQQLDIRSDVAIFTSPQLQENLHLEGIPILKLIVEGDKDGFDICTALSVVNEERTKSEQISTGILRVLDTQAIKNTPREVIFQAIVADLKKGQHLRIAIAGSSWPAIGINPGDKSKSIGAPSAHCNVITMTLQLAYSNFRVLPLLS